MDALEYRVTRDHIDRYERTLRALYGYGTGALCSVTPEREAKILRKAKLDRAPTNEERSACEVFEWLTSPPERYFAYINESTHEATTWMGDRLGSVYFGREYKCPAFGGFPSKRVPVTIHGTNGRTYHGTYFKSAGSYARVRLAQASRPS